MACEIGISLSILAVEDRQADFLLLRRAVLGAAQALGVTVELLWRRSVEEYKELAPTEQPALLFVDVHLPGQSGLDLLAQVRNIAGDRAPRVVLVSSYPESHLPSHGRRQTDYLLKTLAYEEYSGRVKAILGAVAAQASVPCQASENLQQTG